MEYNILMAVQEMRNPILDVVLPFLSSLGDKGMIWIAAGAILMLRKKYRKEGFLLLISLLLVLLTGNVLLKNVIARDRPCWIYPEIELLIKIPHDYSFPSGHSMASFAGAVGIYLTNKKWGILAIILAGTIAFSRLYLFVHWPSDVLAGSAVGVLISLLVFGIGKNFRSYIVT